MAVSEQKQGGNTYLIYGYWDGIQQKNIRIYCGKKGEAATDENLAKAKQQHYETKLKRLQGGFK